MNVVNEKSSKHAPMVLGLALGLLVTATACDASVNRSIRVADGETVRGGLSSVNGSIDVGSRADVTGKSRTVNGKIDVDSGARVESLETVNGTIRVAGDVMVQGDVSSVNGTVDTGPGTEIRGEVSTVNGKILLEGTTVGRGLRTNNGSVVLEAGSRVQGDIHIEKVRNRGPARKPLEIRIESGSVVDGDIVAERGARRVKVYIDADAEVRGEVRGAEVVRR